MFAPSISRRGCIEAPRPPSTDSQPSTLNSQHCRAAFTPTRSVIAAFTLLELLIVVGIIGLLLVLIAPAFTTIKGGTDVTSAAYTIKGALDTARTYAKANNTYTWVGFFEEDASLSSTNPATAGTGRIVISTVASKDGTVRCTLQWAIQRQIWIQLGQSFYR